MSCRQSKGSTIAEYNDNFMNRARIAESWGGALQLPGVINIVFKDKFSGVEVSQLDSTANKALNNKVCERLLVVLFI